ncbi:MAG: TlpA family protein disulfide reductase [Angustibacter sp.]
MQVHNQRARGWRARDQREAAQRAAVQRAAVQRAAVQREAAQRGPGLLPVLFGRLVRAAGVVVVLGIGACGADGADSGTVSGQAQQQGGRGYVAGDGRIEQIAPSDRTTTIELRGNTLQGMPLDTSTWRGDVVVVNTWGSWCPPCNAEAPALARLSRQYADRGVRFVGVNLREGPQTGQAFVERFGLDYPSLAWDGGGVVLQLKGKASTAPPVTLVLDRQGRYAARISGEVEGSVLSGLLDDVLAERPSGDSGQGSSTVSGGATGGGAGGTSSGGAGAAAGQRGLVR